MENKGKSVKVEDLQNERVEDSFDSIQYERVEDSFDGLQSDTNIALQEDKMQKHGDCVEASSKATKDFDLNIKADCGFDLNEYPVEEEEEGGGGGGGGGGGDGDGDGEEEVDGEGEGEVEGEGENVVNKMLKIYLPNLN
ncbi:hypothetical protein GLYMA_04G140200v4 [Glycine max]|uniref:Uncharacterized protein n=1 Tax=Glycine max TaxID=3847 RepID=A0A0R0K880_SOYBN|nr:hypothetical protein GLYMA_04G140200v4 [Glycine max]